MKKFSKISIFLVCLCFCFSLFGCNKTAHLEKCLDNAYVNIFEGQSDTYKLKCNYGFSYTDSGDKTYIMDFILLDKELDSANYSINFTIDEINYNGNFKLNPVSNTLRFFVQTSCFTSNSFEVVISSGGQNENVKLNSILVDNTISYLEALDYLQKNASNLVESYIDANGNFNGKISLKIIVNKNKPYYFVTIKTNDNKKAFLIDGLNGNILAYKDIL